MDPDVLKSAIQTFDLQEHADRMQDRVRDRSLGLIAMVIGAGNFGKSSLVNALCGAEVAPVSVVPKTFKIDVFTNGPSGRALVRRVGEARGKEMAYEKARLLEAEQERKFKSSGKPFLAEIVWRHDNLALPEGISIVDTPGISQALAGSAKGISLTHVLGSSFEVDEVWAHWFHRADVVIWAFCANKLEDADTRAALESSLRLFDKPIIPVATKADLIPSARWGEIRDRFQRVYGSFLDRRQAGELHLTVCGGSKPELAGAGVADLRETLAEVAAEAAALKRRADASFMRDEAKAVALVLEETARVVVSNLRVIASLGDALATEAAEEASRGKQEAASRINGYLRTLKGDPRLAQAAKYAHQATGGGRADDIRAEARLQLIALIDEAIIEAEVNEAFNLSAHALEAAASRLAHGADVVRLSFRSNGIVSRRPIALELNLEAVSVTSKLDFSMRLAYPSGFLGNAWDVIKRLLGIDRFSVADIHAAMTDALCVPESDLDPAMRQALYEGFAPAVQRAVQVALSEHLLATDARALELLREVDAHLPELERLAGAGVVTAFGPQGSYWASLDPAVEVLLGLARVELARLLPAFRTLMVEPLKVEPPNRLPVFRDLWRRRTVARDCLAVEVALAPVILGALFRDRVETEGIAAWRNVPFWPHLQAMQLSSLEASPLISQLDQRLAASITGVRYRSAGSRVAEAGAGAFQAAVSRSERAWSLSIPLEPIGPWGAAHGTRVGLGILLTAAASLAFIDRASALVFLLSAVLWPAIGLARPYIECALRYRAGIASAIALEIQACQKDAAGSITEATIGCISEGISAELAPRPLQRLLIEAGLLGA